MARKPEVSVLIKARDLASQVFGRFQRNLRSVVRTAKNVAAGVTAVGAAVTATVEGLRRMAERGADVVAVQRAFAKVTGDAEGALQRLRDATQNTVSDYNLMRSANQAIALGAADSAEQFAEMARQARLLGRAQGIDATEALEKYTVALARQSKLRLDDLGIVIDQEEAEEKLAATLGKTADKLTEAEKATAFRNEAMERADELIRDLTDGELGAVEAGDRLAATIQNIKDALVELVATSPQISSFLDGLALFLQELSGQDVAVAAIERSLARIDDIRVLQDRYQDFVEMLPQGGGSIDEINDKLNAMGLTGQDVGQILLFLENRIAALSRPRAAAGGGGGGESDYIPGPGVPAIGPLVSTRTPLLPGIGRPTVTPIGPLGPMGPAKDVEEAGEAFGDAAEVAVSGLFAMGEAAVRGTDQVAESVIGMLTAILQQASGGGILGTVIGGIGGIVSGFLGRGRNDPLPVRMEDVSDRARDKLNEADERPLRITTIIEQGGITIEEIERELFARQDRDETVRFSSSATPLRR